MGWDRYLPFLPIILNWIQQTLDAHAHERRPVSSFNFPRLPHYFSEGLLNKAFSVLVAEGCLPTRLVNGYSNPAKRLTSAIVLPIRVLKRVNMVASAHSTRLVPTCR